MIFDDTWKSVTSLHSSAMDQVLDTLSKATKKKLRRLSPNIVSRIVLKAIEDVNNGLVKPLDELIGKRL